MKEVLYAAERGFLERYLKERASATVEDFKTVASLWDTPVPRPGSAEAVNEIYLTEGDTAHIRIEGPLSMEGPDIWDLFFGYGGTSYKTIQAAMEKARNDSNVAKVIFEVNSPGGTLDGVDETWQAHRALASEKPTEVHAGSLLASAAYWISTPAGKILATSPVSEIGSIGVLVATYDWSKWEESIGIKEVVITSSNAPDKYPDVSTDKGRDTIKTQIDALERIFYRRVSECRGVSNEYIAAHFGRGGLVVALDPSKEHEDAIRVKMIDGLLEGPSVSSQTDTTVSTVVNIPPKRGEGEKCMDLENEIEKLKERIDELEDKVDELQEEGEPEEEETEPSGKSKKGSIKNLKAKLARVEKAKAEYAAKVDRMMPIMTSAAYPANIKALAGDVLVGKKDIEAFDAAVAIHDSNEEAKKSAAAQGQTQELGAQGADAPSFIAAAEQELDAAITAAINRRKER